MFSKLKRAHEMFNWKRVHVIEIKSPNLELYGDNREERDSLTLSSGPSPSSYCGDPMHSRRVL